MIVEKKVQLHADITPHYILVYNYTVGDSDGESYENMEISLNNPYLERYMTLLNSLKPVKGYWGVTLDRYNLKTYREDGQMTEDDYNFLEYLMFEDDHSDNSYNKENDEFSWEFYDGVRSQTSQSFLTFDGAELYKIKEDGTRVEMQII